MKYFTFFAAAIFFTGCAAPAPTGPKVDPQYARESNAALAAFDQGLASQAVLLYERALTRAEAMDNARFIGDAAYNLAVAITRAGTSADLAHARVILHEAALASARAGGDTVGVLLLEAKIARMQNDRAASLALADQVLAQSKPGSPNVSWAHILKGDLAADAGDAGIAASELQQADREANNPGVSQRGALAGLSARVALLSHDTLRAANEFDRQADLLQQAGLYAEMAAARAHAGQAWLESHHPAEAADRLYRAARSAAAQKDEHNAGQWTTLAAKAAEQAGNKDLIEQIRRLSNDRAISTQPVSK